MTLFYKDPISNNKDTFMNSIEKASASMNIDRQQKIMTIATPYMRMVLGEHVINLLK